MRPTVAVLIDGGFCVPFGKMAHNPISKKAIDFSKTEIYNQRLTIFEELKKKRKLALRLGHIKNSGSWQIYSAKVKALSTSPRWL
jgi:hypothetical protein